MATMAPRVRRTAYMAKGDAIVVFRPMVDSGDDGGVPGSEIDSELDRNRSMPSPAPGGWLVLAQRVVFGSTAGGAQRDGLDGCAKNLADCNLKCNFPRSASISPGK